MAGDGARMGEFHQELWGFNAGEWSTKYWKVINESNKSYDGITAADFLQFWFYLDRQAFNKIEE